MKLVCHFINLIQLAISGVFIITLFASEENFSFPYRDTLLKISLISVWLLNLINITLAQSFIYKNTQSSIAATFIALLSKNIYLYYKQLELTFNLYLKDSWNIC